MHQFVDVLYVWVHGLEGEDKFSSGSSLGIDQGS